MALIQTDAIVLSSLKFGDTSLIVKCFTASDGLKSYILKGILQSKKSNLKSGYFQPLQQLKLVANHQPKKDLHLIKEVTVAYHYQNIPNNLVKKTLVMFLAEVLINTIKEEEENQALYEYLENAFIWLDLHDKVANFHLIFLLQLTKYLGFYPDTYQSNYQAFNLMDGVFINKINNSFSVDGKKVELLKQFLGTNFDDVSKLILTKTERQMLLDLLITYYQLHLSNFKKPKSIAILQTVFN
ncbi:MAG: DNA repair protein RecO [Polaribacter sp.]|nr:DNA repair protein RecO [Polaribacter sp.]